MEPPPKGLTDHLGKKAFPSPPHSSGKCQPSGRNGIYRNGTWDLSYFQPLDFSKLSLFHSPSNLPCPLFAPFILLVFLFCHFLLFQCAIPLRPFSFLSHLLIFQSPWTITIPFCAWSKSSPSQSPSLSCPFLSTPPTWKAPFFWCNWKEDMMREGEF